MKGDIKMLTLYIIITLLLSAIVQTFMQCVSWFAFYRLVKKWEKERENNA